MDPIARILLTLGVLGLCALVANLLGRRTPLPRVTLLMLLGVAVGPQALDLVGDLGRDWFEIVATIALTMVGFLVGGGLTKAELVLHGRRVVVISVAVTLATATVVFAGLLAFGVDATVALVLATVATSTAPAATAEVVRESEPLDDGLPRRSFPRTLLGVVAVDDVWGLVLFGLVLAALPGPNGVELGAALSHGAWEVLGAALVGVAVGVPMAFVSGRLDPGEPTQVEALSGVLVCGGLALWLGVSHLLAAVVLGAVVANLARHHTRPFAAIEGIEWPFVALFFLLAGASLEFDALAAAGWIGAGYLVLRFLGRLVGGAVGGRLAELAPVERRWIGPALLPQAGVAIGMTLALTQARPELASVVLPVVLGSTAIFELVGPPLTRLALTRVASTRFGAGDGPGDAASHDFE